MAIFKCKMCGGELDIQENETVAICDYCGTKQTVPTSNDEEIRSLFNRANTLRIKSEFDKSEQLYEKILSKDDKQSEAYWGVLLCKFGIEYVEDPKTDKRIPTCHRASYEAFTADEYYKLAIENADSVQREIYEQEAKYIDKIQKEILAISQEEEPYDVFICYKETGADGNRTQDSAIANDIYYQLTQEGYKVFYAAITLEDKLGTAYEPVIFAALNSAKVMLAIGTKPEYFNAVWVKNEWSRYLKMMKSDRTKLLIPCYKDMDAYELPEEFAHLQAQDMGKVGFINDIVRGIKKVIVKTEEKPETKSAEVGSAVSGNVASLLKRAFMYCEDGDFENANTYAEKVLDIDPELAEAYLVKFMCDLKVKTCSTLGTREEMSDFSGNNYDKLIKFAKSELKDEIMGYYNQVAESNYIKACKLMEVKDNLTKTEQALNIFNQLNNYKDSEVKIEECSQIASTLKDSIIERLASCRARIKCCKGMIAAGLDYTAGLKSDGKVKIVGGDDTVSRAARWTDIKFICANQHWTYGLKTDGKLVTTKNSKSDLPKAWKTGDIVAISAGDEHLIGLKTDGTVVAFGSNNKGQCNVSDWRDIVEISAGDEHTVGLKSDGTVIATGNNNEGQCNVSAWRDIVAISTKLYCTIGVKSDGTVLVTNKELQEFVSAWNDIIAVAQNGLAGIKSDGTVVFGEGTFSFSKEGLQKFASDWRDIVSIYFGRYHVVGLKSDGTVVAVGSKEYCYVSGFKLFNSIDTLEQEREDATKKAKEKQAQLEAKKDETEKKKIALNKEKEQLNNELSSLGFFAFSRKKEIQARLAQIDIELAKLK